MSTSLKLIAPMVLLSITLYSQDVNGIEKYDRLAKLVGTWTVKVEVRLASKGPWETSTGNSTFTKEVGENVLEENFSGTRKGRPFHTKTLLAANNQTKKFQRVFVDSEHGGTLVDSEGIKESENTFVFDKTWALPNGSTVKLRGVYKIISDDEFIFESMRMAQDAVEWDTTGRMRYTRKK